MMRFLILLALCVAASQARSTHSTSRMKLLSRVLNFLDEREDDSEESEESVECECPTLEEVQEFVAAALAAGSAEGPPERPEEICKLKDCFDPEDVEVALGCVCPDGPPTPGEEPAEGTCPRFVCRSLRDGPPGGRSGPRGGGSRGPPSAEKKRDESYECECRPPPPPGAPPPSGESDGLPPCPPEDCSGSGPEPEAEEDRRVSSLKTRAKLHARKYARRQGGESDISDWFDSEEEKRHARRSHARREDPEPEGSGSGEWCLCPCPPDMECEDDSEYPDIPPCMEPEEECGPEPERRKSAPRTRALVNLLKSLLH